MEKIANRIQNNEENSVTLWDLLYPSFTCPFTVERLGRTGDGNSLSTNLVNYLRCNGLYFHFHILINVNPLFSFRWEVGLRISGVSQYEISLSHLFLWN